MNLSSQPDMVVRKAHTSYAWVWQLLLLWLALRIVTMLWMSAASELAPHTTNELTIALWPPSAPPGAWLNRALLEPMHRWDVHRYRMIVTAGYRLEDGTPQFHPLFPWLATPLYWLTGNVLFSLLVVGSLATALLLPAFTLLARLDMDERPARFSTLFFVTSPFAFALFVPYTEGLFLLCSVLCFLAARQRAWWLAGLAGALATLTRQQGLFLAVPLAWELWEASGRDWRRACAAWRHWLSLALIPAGMLVWLVYRALALNDMQADFSNLQALIYSVLISPSSSDVVPEQAFLWPWQTLWLALRTLQHTPQMPLLIDLVLGGVFVGMVIVAWPHLRISYRIYTVIILLVSFSYYTGPTLPYMGLPRHLLLAFPVFLPYGVVVQQQRSRLLLLGAGGTSMLFLLLLYVIRAWVP